MERKMFSILGLFMMLLGINRSHAVDLRITLRLADSALYSAKYARTMLRADSATILTRLDWLYDEPGFRPPSERATVENRNNRIAVTVSDTSGAARIEHLASACGSIEYRLSARDSVAAEILNRVDDWLRSHRRAAVAGPDSLHHWISYRGYRYRVPERDYSLVRSTLRRVDTTVYGDWRPAFGSLDTGKTDTSRALYFVERQAEMANGRGQFFASVAAHRAHFSQPPNVTQIANESEPFDLDIQLAHDTFCGCDPVQKLAELTTSHIRQRLAMMLDTVVIGAPMITAPDSTGWWEVLTTDTLGGMARDLATILQSGPLFAPLVVERIERVGGN
jgi:hypothetical protein